MWTPRRPQPMEISCRPRGGAGAGGADAAQIQRARLRSWSTESGVALARYLVVHDPSKRDVESVLPPTRLKELARASSSNTTSPRWLKAWSPDLHDDRIFTLWDAESADEVRAALAALKEYLAGTERPAARATPRATHRAKRRASSVR